MKKYKLEVDCDQEIELYGIVATDRDYRLCAYINKIMNYDFTIYHCNPTKKTNDHKLIELSQEDEEYDPNPIKFPYYTYAYKEDCIELFFINNKLENEVLIKELKKYDFFLLIRGQYPEYETLKLINTLNSIPSVSFVSKIDLNDKLKKLLNLLV